MQTLPKGANAPLPPGPVAVRVAASAPVDVSALLLAGNGKVRGDADFVFYNQPAAPGVRYLPDGVDIDPSAVDAAIEQVTVAASLDGRGPATFGALGGLRLDVTVAGERVAEFVPDGLGAETALLCVDVYRRNGQWKVRAVGQGYADGLGGIATDFGVTVDGLADEEAGGDQPTVANAVPAPPAPPADLPHDQPTVGQPAWQGTPPPPPAHSGWPAPAPSPGQWPVPQQPAAAAPPWPQQPPNPQQPFPQPQPQGPQQWNPAPPGQQPQWPQPYPQPHPQPPHQAYPQNHPQPHPQAPPQQWPAPGPQQPQQPWQGGQQPAPPPVPPAPPGQWPAPQGWTPQPSQPPQQPPPPPEWWNQLPPHQQPTQQPLAPPAWPAAPQQPGAWGPPQQPPPPVPQNLAPTSPPMPQPPMPQPPMPQPPMPQSPMPAAPWPPPPAPESASPAAAPPAAAPQAAGPQPVSLEKVTLDKPGKVSLAKRQTVSLTKGGAPALRRVAMGLGWDPADTGRSIDLDASAIVIGANGKKVDSAWFLSQAACGGAIKHSGDNLTGHGEGDDEQITVDLTALAPDVAAVVFVVNSFGGQKFTAVARASCRLVDLDTGAEIARFDLTESQPRTGVVMSVLRRFGASWEMTAIGEFHDGRTVRSMYGTAEGVVRGLG
ncbi:TerD family protein [Pseudonocardia sp. TRM90224]|uniref:TerD family protein n=1 Tax=Pseudonocardia sp. TRM90224 TaxID=2812678 RepID=UPI001E64A816|nr:TerD family protein [Pseudonocardia sp. TRM90224]